MVRTIKNHGGMPPGRNYFVSQLRITNTSALVVQWVKDEIWEGQGLGQPIVSSDLDDLNNDGTITLTAPTPRMSANYFFDQGLPVDMPSPLCASASGFSMWSNGGIESFDEVVSTWQFNAEESTPEFLNLYVQTGDTIGDGVPYSEVEFRYYPALADLVDAAV